MIIKIPVVIVVIIESYHKQMWWYRPGVPASGRLSQEYSVCEAHLGYSKFQWSTQQDAVMIKNKMKTTKESY